MKKISLKINVIIMMMFLIIAILNKASYAVNGTVKVNEIIPGTQEVLDKVRYESPGNLDGEEAKNAFYYLSQRQGVFCLDHTKGLKGYLYFKKVGDEDKLNSNCNKISYILGCQKPDKSSTYSYKNSLIQNYIWKNATDIIKGAKTELTPSSQINKWYDFEKINDANEKYNKFSSQDFGYAQVTNTDIKYTITDEYFRIRELKMNNYTLYYSEENAYVNKTVKYNRYASVDKMTKRAGLLGGIVDVTVTIKGDGKEKKLKYSNGDFSFTYPETRKDKGYNAFPHPGETFGIWIDREKINNINVEKAMTITVKFQSIKVKADEINNAKVYKLSATKSMQPLLSVSAGLKTYTKSKGVNFKISGISIKKEAKLDIKTYISRVKGGGEKDTKTYDYKNEKVQYRCSSDEREIVKQANRASWSESKKQKDRAVVEKGDDVTFTIKIKNNSTKPLTISNVTYSGCKSGTLIDKTTIKSGETIIKTVKVENINTEDKYLKAKIGKIEGSTKVLSSADFFSYKKYYVAVDKYISSVNGEETSIGTAQNAGEADKGDSDIDNENVITGEEIGETPSKEDENFNDAVVEGVDNANNNVLIEGENDSKRVYLQSKDGQTPDVVSELIIGNDQKSYYPVLRKDDSNMTFCYYRIESANPTYVYLNCDGAGNVVESSDIWEYNQYEHYAKVYQLSSKDAIGCYKKDGKLYYYDASKDSFIDITSLIIYDEETKNNYFDLASVPGITVDAQTIENDKINKYYYYEMNGDYYVEANPYMFYDKDGVYFDMEKYEQDNPSGVTPDENEIPDDISSIVEEAETTTEDINSMLKVYLNCDSNGNIIHSTEEKDQYYYSVTDKSGNIVCYWHKYVTQFYKSDIYFIYSQEYNTYTARKVQKDDGGYYILLEKDFDKKYLQTDSSGNIAHTVTAKDTYFYEVKDTEGKVACYWHAGISKNNETILFIYDEQNQNYNKVTAKKDEFGWYIVESDVSPDSDAIYLQCGVNGNVVVSEKQNSDGYQEVKEQTGKTVVCYFKYGQYHYCYGEGQYVAINIYADDGGFYIKASECEVPVVEEGTEVEEEIEKEETTTANNPRNNAENSAKSADPVKISKDDELQFKIVVYNTEERQDSYGVANRGYKSYWKPSDVLVNVRDDLPYDYIKKGDISYSYESSDGRFVKNNAKVAVANTVTFTDIPVPAGGYTTITYTAKIIVEDKNSEQSNNNTTIITGNGENKATIGKVKNSNAKDVTDKNKVASKRKTSSDYFSLQGSGEIPQSTSGGNVFVSSVSHLRR